MNQDQDLPEDGSEATSAYVNQDPDLKAEQIARINFVAGLHRMADWYEANPWVPLPSSCFSNYSLDTKEDAAKLLRSGGKWDKKYVEDSFYLNRDFGPVNLSFMFYRTAVCTRKVVGQMEVPAQPARDAYMRDIVEWTCEPILGDDNA